MPRRNRLLRAAAIALLLGSLCSNHAQATEPGSAFPAKTTQPPILNEKDLFAYKQKGRGTLTGQAFLVSPSGKAITQPGAPVHLIPITPYTRYWFDHNVRTTACSPTEPGTSAETSATPHTPTDCPQEALTRLQTEKRLTSLSPHNQSQPYRTFLVHQNPRRPLLPHQPDRRRIRSPQRRTTSWPSLVGDRTRRRRKTH